MTGDEFYEYSLEALEDIAEDHGDDKRSLAAWTKLLLEKVQSVYEEESEGDDSDDGPVDEDDLPDDAGEG